MKKAKGQSNIDILKKYVAGERPFTQVGYELQEIPSSQRKVGEIWEDSKGKQWIKTDYGIRSYNPKADIIKEEIEKKWICKRTGRNLKWSHTKQDKIALERTGMCFDALIEYETELRIKGLYKDYAAKKVYKNQLAYLEDIKKKLRESYDYTKEHKVLSYVNSNGFVEEWTNESREELLKNIVSDYKECVKAIRNTKSEIQKLSHIEI